MTAESAPRPGRIEPPWTLAQVNDLNAYQRGGRFHPFTCANRGDATHAEQARADGDEDISLLRAERDGWSCPACGYRQFWAHAFMATPILAPAVTPADRLVRTDDTLGAEPLADLLGHEEGDALAPVIGTCRGEWRREGPDLWRAWTHVDIAAEEEA